MRPEPKKKIDAFTAKFPGTQARNPTPGPILRIEPTSCKQLQAPIAQNTTGEPNRLAIKGGD